MARRVAALLAHGDVRKLGGVKHAHRQLVSALGAAAQIVQEGSFARLQDAASFAQLNSMFEKPVP